MKKGVIAALLILVAVIIVSPALVGKFAEQQVDENLNWAATETGELRVTSEGFDRGWFSSEGQHRIELGDGSLRGALTATSGGGDDIPVLLINTHLDHGLIPVTSMGRDEGSLAPGLGSAVSTMVLQSGDESFDLPGAIYTKIGLGGGLSSRYELVAGTQGHDDNTITWSPTTIHYAADPDSGHVKFDGEVGSLVVDGGSEKLTIDGLEIKGDQTQTEYGFAVGDLNMSVGGVTVVSNGRTAGGMKSMKLVATSDVDDGRVNSDVTMNLESEEIPGFGAFSVVADMSFDGADAEALGRVNKTLQSMTGSTDPTQIMAGAQAEFAALFAAGFDVKIKQFDVELPMGTVETVMNIDIPKSDAAQFNWTSLMTNTEANLDLKVPVALMDFVAQMNPQAGMAVGMGFLKKNGDNYEMQAEYKKALLTVNGAPFPIPMGAFQ